MIKYMLTPEGQRLKRLGIDCTPTKGTGFSAGMDLKACLQWPRTIFPMDTVKVLTGVKVFLGTEQSLITSKYGETYPCNLAGLYLPRSSNKGLMLENTVGLLDADYQGESFIKLYNKTDGLITIEPGDRIAQLVVILAVMNEWREVEDFESMTERGELGDGSTGR